MRCLEFLLGPLAEVARNGGVGAEHLDVHQLKVAEAYLDKVTRGCLLMQRKFTSAEGLGSVKVLSVRSTSDLRHASTSHRQPSAQHHVQAWRYVLTHHQAFLHRTILPCHSYLLRCFAPGPVGVQLAANGGSAVVGNLIMQLHVIIALIIKVLERSTLVDDAQACSAGTAFVRAFLPAPPRRRVRSCLTLRHPHLRLPARANQPGAWNDLVVFSCAFRHSVSTPDKEHGAHGGGSSRCGRPGHCQPLCQRFCGVAHPGAHVCTAADLGGPPFPAAHTRNGGYPGST